MRKFLSILAAACMTVCLLCGCDGQKNGGETKENIKISKSEETVKDTITVLVASEPSTLDPSRSNNDNIALILRYVCDKIFELNPDGTYGNVLCESYEYLDDTTVQINLKKGVLFSDGTPLTAEDILWHYTRTSQQSVSASQFVFIDTENSYVKDDNTLVLKFTQKWAPWINTLAGGRANIVSKAAYEKMGEEKFSRAPVGTGPYKVDEWVSGSYIKLSANENYWKGTPETKNIMIKFVEESTSRVIELETGAADIAYYIEGNDIERVNKIDGYHVEMGDSYRYFIITFSMKDEITSNQLLRQALCTAIDKNMLAEACSDGIGSPIDSYSPPLIVDDYVKEPDYEYNLDQARRMLAEAGYPDGVTIELHIESSTIMKRLAESVQAMWKEIGVNAEIKESALATYTAENNGHFQICIRDGSAQEISNVWTIYESSFGSRLEGNDDWLDQKLLELRTYYPGDEKRPKCTKEIADYLYDKSYSYPIMVMPTIYAVSDSVQNFEFHPNQNNLCVDQWVVK